MGGKHSRVPGQEAPTARERQALVQAAGRAGLLVLTFSLSGADAGSFAIDAGTGQLTTVEGVSYDYETEASYALVVTADGASTSINVSISLTDLEESAPNRAPAFDEGENADLSLAENSPAGQPVGAAIAATDPDDDGLTYSLSGTDAASFDVESATGQLLTKEGVAYDYEARSSYSVMVEVSDGNGGTASIAVTVSLTDVDEATPVTACFTDLGTLMSAAEYAGSWDDGECKAHHQDSRTIA